MKITLDLSCSLNNYHWENEKELELYILEMKAILWKFYQEHFIENENIDTSVEEKNRFYDILDMFTRFEITEKNRSEKNEK